jgi:hypothetical protein
MLFEESGIWLRGLAALALLLASPVARAASALPATYQSKPNQIANTKRSDDKSAKAPAGVVLGRREAIARLLESGRGYGLEMMGPPKLTEAKFAGPFEYKGLFQAQPATIFCVSAKVEYPIFATTRVTVLAIVATPDGKERIVGRTGMNYRPAQCSYAPYGSFPELERARQKHREAMGKTD